MRKKLFKGIVIVSFFSVISFSMGCSRESITNKNSQNNPDPAKFPDPSRAMTKEAAEKAFAGLVEMKLS